MRNRKHQQRRALAALAGLVVFVAGCGTTTTGHQSAASSSSVPSHHPAHRSAHGRSKPHHHPAAPGGGCPAGDPLAGVYHPERLRVLNRCQHATGTVDTVRHEPDGDLHIDVALDPADKHLLDSVNGSEQHGDLVVEFMARDGGHLPEPSVGDRIALLGVWVDDTQHGWNEIHPVFAARLNGGAVHFSGPQFGGSPAGDRSYNAAEDCRTPSGNTCIGYGSVPSSGSSAPRPAPPASSTSGSGCEPGYSPCLPITGDLNCADIPADKKPVRVTGSDPYHLDADHNGIGCQNG